MFTLGSSRIRRLFLALAAFLVLATSGMTTASGQSTSETTPTLLPGTALGEQIAWVLGVLNSRGTALTAADVSDRFAPAFLDSVPAEQMVALVQGWAAAGPFTFDGFTRPPTATQANVFGTAGGGLPIVLPLSIEIAPPHRITGMNLAPVPPPGGDQLAPVVDVAGIAIAEPGRIDGLFDVGDGRLVYLSCTGTGGPTVVLEAGHNDLAASWFAVERAVVPFSRVCSYDRANTSGSASDPAQAPRTGVDTVADLHALLTAADIPGPYVLVGHSLGGHIIRLYNAAYPDEVAGLVLVDVSHEDEKKRLEALLGPELWQQSQGFMTGINLEGIDLDATDAEVRAARATVPLRSIPLAVISAGRAWDPSVFPPGWPVAAYEQLVRELQADLATLAPNARHIIATNSDHYVHQSEPELVVEAIRQVVEAVHEPSTWTTTVAATPVA